MGEKNLYLPLHCFAQNYSYMAFFGGGEETPENPDVSQMSHPSFAIVLEVCHLRFIPPFDLLLYKLF